VIVMILFVTSLNDESSLWGCIRLNGLDVVC